jgi:hypothetical protein
VVISREVYGVAFIRPKKVHGYEYYQVVRNYRDRDGKHRQEMLDHLGTHDSIEATVDFRKQKVTFHREQAKTLSKSVDDLKAELQDLYSDDLGGDIPSREEAWEDWDRAYRKLYLPDDHRFPTPGSLLFERLESDLIRADKTMDYYDLISRADEQKTLARRWQEKLSHLLDIQATYS